MAQVKNQKINHNYLKNTEIILEKLSQKENHPYKLRCKVEITDNFNRVYSKEVNVWCREHNSEMEMQRARIYE